MARKTHIVDILLINNAGIRLPVCQAGRALLDTSNSWPLAIPAEATCKRCQAAYARRYPWTVR